MHTKNTLLYAICLDKRTKNHVQKPTVGVKIWIYCTVHSTSQWYNTRQGKILICLWIQTNRQTKHQFMATLLLLGIRDSCCSSIHTNKERKKTRVHPQFCSGHCIYYQKTWGYFNLARQWQFYIIAFYTKAWLLTLWGFFHSSAWVQGNRSKKAPMGGHHTLTYFSFLLGYQNWWAPKRQKTPRANKHAAPMGNMLYFDWLIWGISFWCFSQP